MNKLNFVSFLFLRRKRHNACQRKRRERKREEEEEEEEREKWKKRKKEIEFHIGNYAQFLSAAVLSVDCAKISLAVFARERSPGTRLTVMDTVSFVSARHYVLQFK